MHDGSNLTGLLLITVLSSTDGLILFKNQSIIIVMMMMMMLMMMMRMMMKMMMENLGLHCLMINFEIIKRTAYFSEHVILPFVPTSYLSNFKTIFIIPWKCSSYPKHQYCCWNYRSNSTQNAIPHNGG